MPVTKLLICWYVQRSLKRRNDHEYSHYIQRSRSVAFETRSGAWLRLFTRYYARFLRFKNGPFSQKAKT